jgi:hypothetical protein
MAAFRARASLGAESMAKRSVNACRSLEPDVTILGDMVFEEREVMASRPMRSERRSIGDIPPILFTQRADGSWDLTAELANACGADLDELRAAAASLGIRDAERVLATLLATRLVESLPSRVAVTLDPAVHKALMWIRMVTNGVTEPAGGWPDWAASLVPHLRKK